jgi:hypothetical protein
VRRVHRLTTEAGIRGENGLLTRQTFGRSSGKVAGSNLGEEIREMGIPANIRLLNGALNWAPFSLIGAKILFPACFVFFDGKQDKSSLRGNFHPYFSQSRLQLIHDPIFGAQTR